MRLIELFFSAPFCCRSSVSENSFSSGLSPGVPQVQRLTVSVPGGKILSGGWGELSWLVGVLAGSEREAR